MKNTRRITILAVLTAASLCTFVLEAQIPPLFPTIPGIKLGLSNIFTLFTIYILNAPAAASLLGIRVILGSFVTGQVSALGYSLCGGLLSFGTLLLFYRRFPRDHLWVLSAICAVAHNLGQVLLACLVMGSRAILWYLPALVIAALVTGSFTGLICQLVLFRMRKSYLWKEIQKLKGDECHGT